MILLDKKMEELCYPLDSRFTVFLLNDPNKTSRNISIAKPIIASASQWLED